MQRIARFRGKLSSETARKRLFPQLARQIAGAGIAALCAMLPLDYAAIAICVPMCAAQIVRGTFAPLCLIAAAGARVICALVRGDAFLWCDAAAILLVCAGVWGVCRNFAGEKKRMAAFAAPLALVVSRVLAWRLLTLDWIILIAQAACAMALYPVFSSALGVLHAAKKRTVLSSEETLCCALTLAAILAGAAPIRIFGFSPSAALCYVSILVVCRGAGAGLGAGCAAVMGLALAVGMGGKWMMIANLTVCAVACAPFQKIGRWAGALSFVMVNALMTLVVNASGEVILNLRESLPAAAAFAFLPAKWIDRVCERVSDTARREHDRDTLLRRADETVRTRVLNTADVFSQMAACFSSVAGADETSAPMHTTQMMSRVCGEVCARCALLNVCWKREYDETYEAMYDALEKARESGKFDPRQINPDFARRCLKTQQMIDCVNKTASLYVLQNQWERRMDESRMLIAQQLSGAAGMMRRTAENLHLEECFDSRVEHDVRVCMDRRGMPQPQEVIVESGGACRVCIRCERPNDRVVCVREGAAAVSEALGRKMRMAGGLCALTRDGTCSCSYVQSARYELVTGCARQIAENEEVSGDFCDQLRLDATQFVMALSDGMGNGPRAQAESTAAVKLLLNFFKAGFSREAALETINRLLLLRSGEEMFSTVDLCQIDCASGACLLTKIAAAPGIVRKNGRMHLVSGEALPMGVADAGPPEAMAFDLREGDGVVLMSDGVTDALGEAALVPLCEAFWRDCDGQVQPFCEALVQAARACCGDRARDDMTVTAAFLTRA